MKNVRPDNVTLYCICANYRLGLS